MEERTIEDYAKNLKAKAADIANRRAEANPAKKKKGGFMSWLSKEKKDYTDQALDAVQELCTQIPSVMRSYAESTNKVMFAATNVRTLMSMKSNLDALDPDTWVPKVVDSDTYELAEAYGEFINNIYKNHQQTLGFLEYSKPDEVKYEVVKKLPSKPDPATIYIQKDGDKINYRYRAESDPNSIITGEMPEKYLGGHKDGYTNPDYFKENLYKTDNPKAFGKSIADMLHKDTKYYKHNAHESSLDTLNSMRKDVGKNLETYKSNTSEKGHSKN